MSDTYSQHELLLLSNFVYIPACLSDRPIGEIIGSYRGPDGKFTEDSVAAAAAGGGMSCADVKTVFCEMDKKIREDPSFGELSAARRLEESDVRAVLYTNAKDDEPVVVFRGTGGTQGAWTDNFEGAYLEDTKIQKLADDFVRNECAIYSDIVATGHSKGGNLAQYVTVKEQDMVGSCVSFDGQGFGPLFCENNSDGIREASGRICSICAYNDFVGILLTGIAGTVIYVANDPTCEGAHSSVTLLTHNTFDENGNFTSVREQGGVSAGLDRVTDSLCGMLSPMDLNDKETLAAITGSAVSLALTTRDGLLEGCIAPVMGAVGAAYIKKVAQNLAINACEKPLAVHSVYIDVKRCRAATDMLEEQSKEAGRLAEAVSTIRQSMAYTINSRIFAEHALEKIYYDLIKIGERLRAMSELVGEVLTSYEQAERDAASLMNLQETQIGCHGTDDIILLGE